MLQRLTAGSQRLVMRSKSIASLRFSPDSTKIAAIAGGKRVRVYDLAADKLHVAAEGDIRGYSFAPDGKSIVFGRAEGADFQAKSDLYVTPVLGGRVSRLTELENALNPVWGPKEIVFDRFKRRKGDAPAFNLWALTPLVDDSLRRLTNLTIPPLVSGLVPLELSANARRLLTVFTGQDTRSASRCRCAPASRARCRRTSSAASSASTSPRTARRSSRTPAARTRRTSTTW